MPAEADGDHMHACGVVDIATGLFAHPVSGAGPTCSRTKSRTLLTTDPTSSG